MFRRGLVGVNPRRLFFRHHRLPLRLSQPGVPFTHAHLFSNTAAPVGRRSGGLTRAQAQRLVDHVLELQDDVEPLLNLGKKIVRNIRVFQENFRTGVKIFLALLLGGIAAREAIFRFIGESSEKLTQEILEHNTKHVVATIDHIVKDPKTIDSLVTLLQELLNDQKTKDNLVKLLITVFQDKSLSEQTGKFLLEALDTPNAKQALDSQVRRIVSAAVLNKQVQADAGTGISRAVGFAFNPFMWLYWPRKPAASKPKAPPKDGVEVFGLTERTELNGVKGTIVSYVPEEDRYIVKLGSDNGFVILEDTNLRRLS